MEQRVYHGRLTVDGLADFLVQKFDPQENLQAQKLGAGDSCAVQIGQGDTPADIRNAITVGITRATDAEEGVAVTIGQQQWIRPEMIGYAAVIGLIGVLITPWALFGLLWPLQHMLSATALPGMIWSEVEAYALSQGATLARSEDLRHPHDA
jgi:hypothetical protein